MGGISVTGRDLVSACMRLIGALAPGETSNATEATDGLASINRMIDSWSNEGLLVYSVTQESPFSLVPGDGTVTLGTSGDITTRPMSVERAIVRNGTTDFPLNIISSEEYTSIQSKILESSLPNCIYDDGGYPQRILYLYPVPSAAYQLILWTKRPITTIATLDTTISLPPGYERALVYNGAIELSADYGRPPNELVYNIANESKATLKRLNHRASYLRADNALVAGRSFNFEKGESGR